MDIGRSSLKRLLEVGVLVICLGWLHSPVQSQERKAEEKPGPRQTATKSGEAQESILKSGEAKSAEKDTARTAQVIGATVPPLPRFGYDIFNNLAPDTTRTLYGPVDPGYVIGPGDQVIVNVWGQVEFTLTLTVSREGAVDIPKVGPVSVNGLTLSALKSTIINQLSKVYSGIAQQPPTTFVDVSLGKLLPIRVFILGEVKRPGSYTINPTSTVLNTLYHCGGPNEKGSLREIKVFRQNKLVALVDLYNYILKGDKSQDIRLQNDDTILMPPARKTVSLSGRVHRQAIYELKGEERLKDLLDIAGGLEPDAYIGQIQIDRIIANKERRIVDVDFEEILSARKPDSELSNGDAVTVFAVSDQRINALTLKGYVRRPGLYQLKAGMRVKDLIEGADGLLGEAHTERADLIRTNPDLTKHLVSFRLGGVMKGDPHENLLLQSLDEVIVYSIHTFGERDSVTITGSVKKPGRYELLSDMTLKDLIVFAGGLKEGAYKVKAEMSRVNPNSPDPNKPVQILHMDIDDRYSAGGREGDFKLQGRDIVFIRPDPKFEPQRNVTLSGDVQFPGVYTLESRAERLSSLIARAGGLKDTAYPEGIVFLRSQDDAGRIAAGFERTPKSVPSTGSDLRQGEVDSSIVNLKRAFGIPDELLRHDDMARVAVDLKRFLKHRGSEDDPVLFDGDVIMIPQKSRTVKVSGEVGFPNNVAFKDGEGIGYYIDGAGGLKPTADKGRIFVILANGEVKRPGRSLTITAGSVIVVPAKGGGSSAIIGQEQIGGKR